MSAVHLILPAAGVGKRFGLAIPKQYCEINGKPVMDWTLSAFAGFKQIASTVIALQPTDHYASPVLANYPHVLRVDGGKERSDSVRNALIMLKQYVDENDWILVHDVARPCIRQGDVSHLIERCLQTGTGGVLGRPVTDTIKQKLPTGQWKTVDRSSLWSVQTPQCFQLGQLLSALEFCAAQQIAITDEASAIEAVGGAVQIVEGSSDNIKLTHAEDSALIAFYLQQQGRR